jgi:predicted outer membrane protein
VKAFGQRMIDDHSKANDQLKSLLGREHDAACRPGREGSSNV